MNAICNGATTKILVPTSSSKDWRGYSNGRLTTFLNRTPGIMNLYYIGEPSRFSKDGMEATLEQDKSFLQTLLPDISFSQMAYAQDTSFTNYNAIVGWSWPEDPFSLGSYSYIAAGHEKEMLQIKEIKGEKIKQFFAPEDSMFFTGEHTSILPEIGGTMEAAVESGERIARLIHKSTEKPIDSNRYLL